MPETTRLTVDEGGAGERLDRFLAQRLPDFSRARVQALIETGQVLVDGRAARASHRVALREALELTVPDATPVEARPEAIPLDVVYEDGDLLVVNKPAGLVVHPAPGHASGTLVNALLAHCPNLQGIGGELRPGIVHRLDKDTSGLLVVAKHERAHRFLSAQLKERRMDKRYLALVDGGPKVESGTVNSPVARDKRRPAQMAVAADGKPAVTHFRVLRRYARHTLLECKLVTGRTHQIRVHLAAIDCPVAGDRVYGRKQPSVALERHFLHAARLTFQQLDGAERTCEAPLPPELEDVLTRIA